MLRYRLTSQLRGLRNGYIAITSKSTSNYVQVRKQSSSSDDQQSSKVDYGKILGIGAIALSIGTIYYMKTSDGRSSGKKTPAEDEDEEIDDVKHPPPIIAGLPEKVTYIIVGAGTSAFAAYRAIRAKDPKAQVLLIGEEKYAPYMRPPLSKEMWYSDKEQVTNMKFKQWNGKERSVFFEKDAYYCTPEELTKNEGGGVSVITGVKVVKVDVKNHRVSLNTGQDIDFEKLLLAPGGRPKALKVISDAGKEVKRRLTLFRNIEDFNRLFNKSESKQIKSVAIVGGGFMGSELACALGKRGKETGMTVTQVFPDKGNMGRVLPAYLSKWSTQKVIDEGVEVLTESHVTGCEYNKKDRKVVLSLNNGTKKLSVDHVIVAVGLEPNTDLAKNANLETSEAHGGYLVNAELEARTDVYVAGDAACFYDINLGRRRVEHHDHAVVSGRLAGGNMAGANKPYYHQSMFWSDLGPKIAYEAIGIVDSQLKTTGVYAQSDEKEGKSDNYDKGVIFYMYENKIVGMVLWNVFNKIDIARKLINESKEYESLEEVAKLFELYGKPDTTDETTTELPKVPA